MNTGDRHQNLPGDICNKVNIFIQANFRASPLAGCMILQIHLKSAFIKNPVSKWSICKLFPHQYNIAVGRPLADARGSDTVTVVVTD